MKHDVGGKKAEMLTAFIQLSPALVLHASHASGDCGYHSDLFLTPHPLQTLTETLIVIEMVQVGVILAWISHLLV